jgi:peptidoglycan/LPS O-acetylase OafA/YrhL
MQKETFDKICKPQNARNPSLDILRFVAVALVMGRHLWVCPEQTSSILHAITSTICQVGWIGVDLFFVLSGFLISGLLFTDHKTNGCVSIKRFYIRRGFKIYPAFLAFMLVAALIVLWEYSKIRHLINNHAEFWHYFTSWLWPNLLFVQNYVPTNEFQWVWSVKLTWSLAVEEHFYLLLPLLLVALSRCHGSFRALPSIFWLIAVFCLLARISTTGDFTTQKNLMPSHLRFDSLFFGVLLSYWKHYENSNFEKITRHWRKLLAVGVACIAPVFFVELSQSRFIYTIGYTLIYLGAGALLLGMLGSGVGYGLTGKTMAFVGARSYSIYLCHAPAAWISGRNYNPTQGLGGWVSWVICYLLLALIFGLGMFYLVESPMLKVRNKLFPLNVIK